MKEIILELTNFYFNAFKNKDLKLLEELYDENVVLIDWTGQWYGKESVLKSNDDLFQLDYELYVEETNILNNRTYNSISIRFDEGLVSVLDVIDFDNNNKIIKIRAYKG